MPEDAVGCEPVSAPNSLLTGKLTGNLPISGVSAANLTTSLRACARPDRATWAACRRRRGDRVVFFAAIAHSRYWHKAAVRCGAKVHTLLEVKRTCRDRRHRINPTRLTHYVIGGASEGACRERHWCRQLFERGLSPRGLPLKSCHLPSCRNAAAPCATEPQPISLATTGTMAKAPLS